MVASGGVHGGRRDHAGGRDCRPVLADRATVAPAGSAEHGAVTYRRRATANRKPVARFCRAGLRLVLGAGRRSALRQCRSRHALAEPAQPVASRQATMGHHRHQPRAGTVGPAPAGSGGTPAVPRLPVRAGRRGRRDPPYQHQRHAGARWVGRVCRLSRHRPRHHRTDRSRARAAASQGTRRVRGGFVIYDAEDRLVTCNEGYRRIFSADPATTVPGTHLADVLRAGLAKGTYPDVVDNQEAWVEAWLQRLHETTGATEQALKDGKWVLVTNRRMRNGGVAGLRIDITPLKQAQAALRDSETRLDRAQEIADIGSWELDIASGKYAWSRHLYRIRGMPPEFQPTRENIAARINPDDF